MTDNEVQRSYRERLEQAKALIQAKQYAQARRALASINHPTARRWEQQLDKLAPRRKRLRWILVMMLVLALLAALATVPGFIQMNNEQATAMSEALSDMQTDIYSP